MRVFKYGCLTVLGLMVVLCSAGVAVGADYLKYPWAFVVVVFATIVGGEPRFVSMGYTVVNLVAIYGMAISAYLLDLKVDLPGQPLILGTLYGLVFAVVIREIEAIRIVRRKRIEGGKST